MSNRGKKTQLCQLPSPGSISGRSSSITNAFFNSIIPIHPPTNEETLKALQILGMTPDDIRCAYCGDRSTEWDHLKPLITNQKPTGYITELANLVPACGKCNQSKGKNAWEIWMRSDARLSPKTRQIADIELKIKRLKAYEAWRQPLRFDFAAIVQPELWTQHNANWRSVLDLLRASQQLAKEIRLAIEQHAAAISDVDDGEASAVRGGWFTNEEVFTKLRERLDESA